METRTQDTVALERFNAILGGIDVTPKVNAWKVVTHDTRHIVYVNQLVDESTFERHFNKAGFQYRGSGSEIGKGFYVKVREAPS